MAFLIAGKYCLIYWKLQKLYVILGLSLSRVTFVFLYTTFSNLLKMWKKWNFCPVVNRGISNFPMVRGDDGEHGQV